jgi:hypothetical protein
MPWELEKMAGAKKQAAILAYQIVPSIKQATMMTDR